MVDTTSEHSLCIQMEEAQSLFADLAIFIRICFGIEECDLEYLITFTTFKKIRANYHFGLGNFSFGIVSLTTRISPTINNISYSSIVEGWINHASGKK